MPPGCAPSRSHSRSGCQPPSTAIASFFSLFFFLFAFATLLQKVHDPPSSFFLERIPNVRYQTRLGQRALQRDRNLVETFTLETNLPVQAEVGHADAHVAADSQ